MTRLQLWVFDLRTITGSENRLHLSKILHFVYLVVLELSNVQMPQNVSTFMTFR